MSLIVSAMLHHWTAQVIANVKQGYPDIDIAHKSAAMAVPKVPHPNVLFAGVLGVLSLFFFFVSADWSAFASGKHFVNG